MPKKFTYEQIKEIIEKDGTILISRRYENSHAYLDLICPNKHEYKAQFYNFKNGHRCPKCAIKYKADKHRHSYNDVKEYIEAEGYTLISKEYKTNMDYLDIICPKGHKLKKKFAYFKSGDGCSYCYGNANYTYDDIKKIVNNVEGYTLISTDCKNAHTKINIKCPKGHEFIMRFYSFKEGHRCPVYAAGQTSSKGEKEICEFVKSIYSGIVLENDRKTILNPCTGRYLELDIYLPDINFAIEFNGEYYHSSEDAKEKDITKLNDCIKKDILLYIILENNWKNNKQYHLNEIEKIIRMKTKS